MPLNGPQLSAEIRAAIASAVSGNSDPNAMHKDAWDAIAQAIVDHIKNNAVIIQPPDSGGDTESPGTVT